MNNNPTRHDTNPLMKQLLSFLEESFTNYPKENCGEFNAINNALNDGADIHDLIVYSVGRISGAYKPPCANCEFLYGNEVLLLK